MADCDNAYIDIYESDWLAGNMLVGNIFTGNTLALLQVVDLGRSRQSGVYHHLQARPNQSATMNSILRDAVIEWRTTRQCYTAILLTLLKYVDDMPVDQIPAILEKVFKQAGYKSKRTVAQAKEYADAMDRFGINGLDDDAKKIV